MARPSKQAKPLAKLFSVGKTMDSEIPPNSVRAAEGYTTRKKEITGNTPEGVLQSSRSIFGELTGLSMDLVLSSPIQAQVTERKSSRGLPDSNIGFKLLKKSGWTEGTGLGVSEQGRLDPLETQFKSDRRGIGAEKKIRMANDGTAVQGASAEDDVKTTKKAKNLAKRARKVKAEVEKIQEQSFKQDFYREFWPENV